ncbi:hypothetical protein DSCA_40160 [Desulfosarcina alkanivorans]|uniref:Uncharacterized protein n=1 Tax=Desulfosarcina alkanivorans TaxID=571177 RepID=A0A5K7YLI5_9BACT|nr:hypothetical protein [Desulfosarcina alkanivorans]BBO70086.1 hypothetical protein DSCA_40160 [Desulfosarcina alkanivorans]
MKDISLDADGMRLFQAYPSMPNLPDICVALNMLLLEYQPYACGNFFVRPDLAPIRLFLDGHRL